MKDVQNKVLTENINNMVKLAPLPSGGLRHGWVVFV